MLAASTVIFPPLASGKVEDDRIPALTWLEPDVPASISRLSALMLMFPPPVPRTSTSAALVKVISALATSSGKLKLPSSLKPTIPAAPNPPILIFPPLAVASPASNLTSPPTKVKFSPVGTRNPTFNY